ncbi:MAG: hypothetical protein HY301_08270 [Verrucomicrobia bacterium]|nr:hypothetical protein [Verrucomicrobiota bacterium]
MNFRNLLFLPAVAWLVAGCASSRDFDRAWQSASARPAPADSLEGAWTGSWLSYSNGHTGPLRAIITRTPTGYETRFHAGYMGIFSGGYTINLAAAELGGSYQLGGSKDLGKLLFWQLGNYSYAGTATPARFNCQYNCPYDGGVFELKRP